MRRGGTSSLTTTHTINYGLNKVYKVNDVVNFTASITFNSNVSAWSAFATLPNGYRPKTNQFITVFVGGSPAYIQIRDTGAIELSIAATSGQTVGICGTFLAA